MNWVSESCFIRPLAGFSKPDMTVNILSALSAAYRKGFHIHNRLTEIWYKISLSGFSKDLHNYIVSVFLEAVLKCMFKYLKNFEINNLKTMSILTESTDLN